MDPTEGFAQDELFDEPERRDEPMNSRDEPQAAPANPGSAAPHARDGVTPVAPEGSPNRSGAGIAADKIVTQIRLEVTSPNPNYGLIVGDSTSGQLSATDTCECIGNLPSDSPILPGRGVGGARGAAPQPVGRFNVETKLHLEFATTDSYMTLICGDLAAWATAKRGGGGPAVSDGVSPRDAIDNLGKALDELNKTSPNPESVGTYLDEVVTSLTPTALGLVQDATRLAQELKVSSPDFSKAKTGVEDLRKKLTGG